MVAARSRSRLALPALAAALLMCLASAQASSNTVCEEAPSSDQAGYGEATLLPEEAATSRLRRWSGGFAVPFERGEVVFADDPGCALDPSTPGLLSCVEPEFVAAFSDPPGFLIRRHHYEHTDFVWVGHRSGTQVVLASQPRFSPGLRWMLSVSPSKAAHVFNGIELFDVGGFQASLVWQHVPSGPHEKFYMFSFLRWTGPDQALLCAFRENEANAQPHPPSQVVLERGRMGWALREFRD